jgi:hypothetical protein
LAAAGCGNETCGPSATATVITAATSSGTAEYSEFTSSPNNDCPNPGSPTSLTIEGRQVGGPGVIILCVPRPEAANETRLTLDYTAGDALLIDFGGSIAGCAVQPNRNVEPELGARASGLCDDGNNAAGYELELSGTFAATETCGSGPSAPITITVGGSVAVTAIPL